MNGTRGVRWRICKAKKCQVGSQDHPISSNIECSASLCFSGLIFPLPFLSCVCMCVRQCFYVFISRLLQPPVPRSQLYGTRLLPSAPCHIRPFLIPHFWLYKFCNSTQMCVGPPSLSLFTHTHTYRSFPYPPFMAILSFTHLHTPFLNLDFLPPSLHYFCRGECFPSSVLYHALYRACVNFWFF